MNARQKTILELIHVNHIGSQTELQAALANAGFPVAQATISRDIRLLGLIKKADASCQYRYQEAEAESRPEVAAPQQPQQELFADNILRIDHAGNMLAIRCNAGTAQAVCTRIDSMQLPDIVGTLAGDDTIFVLVRSTEQAQPLAQILTEKFQNR